MTMIIHSLIVTRRICAAAMFSPNSVPQLVRVKSRRGE